jgi:hypothetical protein
MKQRTLTGDETVQEVLMMYLEDHVSGKQAKSMFKTFVAQKRDYIEGVLHRKCREKWGHCQVSMMVLDGMLADTLVVNK